MMFNIGDRVRVNAHIPVAHRLCRKVGTVLSRDASGNYPYAVYFESGEHEIFRAEELTLEPAAKPARERMPKERIPNEISET